jgi:hypothetical protein
MVIMGNKSGGSLRSLRVAVCAFIVTLLSAQCYAGLTCKTENDGPVEVGQNSLTILEFQNTGTSSWTVNSGSFTLGGNNPGDFKISYPLLSSCAAGSTVDPNGGICYYEVTFTPQAKGVRSADWTFSVTYNDGKGTQGNTTCDVYDAGFILSPEIYDESACTMQSNAQCISSGAPCPCCTGVGTGSCASSVCKGSQNPAACCTGSGIGTCVDSFPLAYESSTSQGYGYITFDPGGADIKWAGTLGYQTSGQRPSPPASIDVSISTNKEPESITFGTAPVPDPAPTPKAQRIVIAGGQLNLKATYDAGKSGGGSWPNIISGYVTGIPASQSSTQGIPNATALGQLNGLYARVTIPITGVSFSPATADLMTQIAAMESGGSYEQQFFNPPNAKSNYPYHVADSWPLESGDGGSHVGIMQVPISQTAKLLTTLGKTTAGQANAWDWMQNAKNAIQCPTGTAAKDCGTATSAGEYSFQEKLIAAYTNMKTMQKGLTPALTTALTSCQLEEMALAQYGSSPCGADPNYQYYIPQCSSTSVNASYPGSNTCNGPWLWTINTSSDVCVSGHDYSPKCAACYVAAVRAKAAFPSGSVSYCTVTPPLPDPPTNLSNCSACPS